MSVTLADSYRSHAISFPSPAKHDDHGLIVYGSSESELRGKLSGAVYGTDNIPTLFNGQPPTTDSILPHPIPQTRDDPLPHSIYSPSSSQQLPQPPTYGFDLSGPHYSPRGHFRPRSTRNEGHIPPHFPALASLLINANSSVAEPGILLDPSLHQPPSSIYDPAMSNNTVLKISLPEKHHHTLPQSRDSDNMDDNIVRQTRPPNVVGHMGMPAPAPRPKAPKTRFTAAEDALLVHLKENKNLTWLQIQDFFPGRTHNTLQVRYCQRLKTKDVSWTDEKVQRLQRAISQYEQDRWRIISSKVGKGFGPEACRERATMLGRSPSRGL
ncbi:unnamed protein product [Penicillium pancosmium]